MKIKKGVRMPGLHPQVVLALLVAKSIYRERGSSMTITSLTDGKHSATSLHYSGQAVDLRTRDLAPGQAEDIVSELKNSLTEDFDVVLESDHIHLEYQPRVS